LESEVKPSRVRNWKNWAIAVLSIAVIILLWLLSSYKPQDDKKEIVYQDTMKVWRAAKARERAYKDSVSSEWERRAQRQIAQTKRQDKEIRAARARADSLEAALPPQDPIVQVVLRAKNDAIDLLTQQNDSLKHHIFIQDKEFKAFVQADVNEEAIDAKMLRESEARGDRLKRERDRLEEKRKEKNKIITGLLIALGIETAYLALKD
jgi:hypothetical protein